MDQYEASHLEQWNNVAEDSKKWSIIFEETVQQLTDRLIELARIKPGGDNRVLDIATGIGEPAISAAKMIPNTGFVVGIDISPRMISIAEKRATSLGLKNLRFIVGDIEKVDLISLPISTFDSALCRWGLMFLPNLEVGLKNIYNLLNMGGRFAAAVMGEPSKVPLLNVPMRILREQLKLPNEKLNGRPGVFNLSDRTLLETSFTNIGFQDVYMEEIDIVFRFSSPQVYTVFIGEVSAPIRVLLEGMAKTTREEIRRKISEHVRVNYTEANGTVTMHNQSLCIVGRR
jgi:ubiquinone/menaquinone biosynthesis C-methylase UbiE